MPGTGRWSEATTYCLRIWLKETGRLDALCLVLIFIISPCAATQKKISWRRQQCRFLQLSHGGTQEPPFLISSGTISKTLNQKNRSQGIALKSCHRARHWNKEWQMSLGTLWGAAGRGGGEATPEMLPQGGSRDQISKTQAMAQRGWFLQLRVCKKFYSQDLSLSGARGRESWKPTDCSVPSAHR